MESLSMLMRTVVAVLLAVLIASCTTTKIDRSVARIDASTPATAEASYKKMLGSLPQAKQMQLAVAVLTINMIGVSSAYEVVRSPELQAPSIVRIKDRVAGMSADEIIAYAAKNSTVGVEVSGQ
jgi:hypothetical protein